MLLLEFLFPFAERETKVNSKKKKAQEIVKQSEKDTKMGEEQTTVVMIEEWPLKTSKQQMDFIGFNIDPSTIIDAFYFVGKNL